MNNSMKKICKIFAILIVILMVIIGLFTNYSYVIYSAGPTLNTLGKIDENNYLIQIVGQKRKEAKGQLHLTTVSQEGGPDSYINGIRLIKAWFDDEEDIKPYENVFPKNVTQKQINAFNKAQMLMSQQSAIVSAFSQIGKVVNSEITVNDITKDSSFYKKLQKGDKILSIETVRKASASNVKDFYDLLAQTKPGSNIRMEIMRKNKTLIFDGKTLKPIDGAVNGNRGSRLGVVLETKYDFPEKIKFTLSDIGGPSAGLMFSLAILDIISPKPFLGNVNIAGTGTISPNGYVGEIGGVKYKILGAKKENIKWFLLPKENCSEAMKANIKGVRLIPVEKIEQAKKAVENISAGKTGSLPKCSIHNK